nr:hypothetical protein [Mycobacterium lacus]
MWACGRELMAPLAVDPAALDGAGAAVVAAGEGLGSVIAALTSGLAGCAGWPVTMRPAWCSGAPMTDRRLRCSRRWWSPAMGYPTSGMVCG